MSKNRVKRDYETDETSKLNKRQENLAYRSVRYDDPEWQRQWYLVNTIITLKPILSLF